MLAGKVLFDKEERETMKKELFLITSLSHEMELPHTIQNVTKPESEQVFSYS